MDKKRILVTDDDADIRELLTVVLERDGFEVESAENGARALSLVLSAATPFDLIIMDIMMPEMSGAEAASKIRRVSDCPILFLTAKSADADKIAAYEAGGDDFLSKPFSTVELILRINALLKRTSGGTTGLKIDTVNKRVSKNGRFIRLTDKEYELIEFLYKNKGTPYTVEQLYVQVWGEQFFPSSANTVMVHMLNLRKKLENDYTQPEYIKTVWGKGYCYVGD